MKSVYIIVERKPKTGVAIEFYGSVKAANEALKKVGSENPERKYEVVTFEIGKNVPIKMVLSLGENFAGSC